MGRKTVAVSQDAIVRAISAVQKAGVEVKSIRVEPSGAVIINGDNPPKSEKSLEKPILDYL